MTIPPYTRSSVQSWFQEHEDAHLPCPAKSPDLNTIETLPSVLQSTVRRRFPLPSSLKQPEDVLHEGWYSIPLQAIQNLYESIPRRIQDALLANGSQTPY